MSNTAQPLQPELLAPLTVGSFFNTSFAVEPITDSYIARQAENTLKGLVHLWVVSADGKPLTEHDLGSVGITADDLARFVMTKRDMIKAHYLPGRPWAELRLESSYVDEEKIVQVSFILHT